MSIQFRIIDQGETADLRYGLGEVFFNEDGQPIHFGEIIFQADEITRLMDLVKSLLSVFIKPSVPSTGLSRIHDDE
jgi:hypothetical protein